MRQAITPHNYQQHGFIGPNRLIGACARPPPLAVACPGLAGTGGVIAQEMQLSRPSSCECDDLFAGTYDPPHPPPRYSRGMAHQHGDPDDLYTLRQEFYVGNFQVRWFDDLDSVDRSIDRSIDGGGSDDDEPVLLLLL